MISRRHRSQPFKSKLPLTIISHQRYHPRRHPCQNRPPPSWQCHQYHSGERNWSWGPAMGIMASKRRPIIPIQMVERSFWGEEDKATPTPPYLASLARSVKAPSHLLILNLQKPFLAQPQTQESSKVFEDQMCTSPFCEGQNRAKHCTSHLLLLGKFEYGGGPIFKVVLEC